MSELFNGGEMDAFSPADAACYESTNAAYYDADFARAAIRIGGAVSYAESAHWSNTTGIWLHFELLVDTFNATATFLSAYDEAGVEVYRIRASHSAGVLTFTQYYWNGASHTQLGTSFDTQIDVLNTFDVHVDFSASGSGTIYLSGTERLTATADLSGLSGIAYVRLKGSLITYFSQVFADTESTVGQKLWYRYPNGTGASTDWTGGFGDIDEAVYADVDFINSASVNQVSTFTFTGPTVTGYTVRSVTVSARAKRDSTGPQNLRLALRSSGTPYFSSADKALGLGYTPQQTIWSTDPATAAAWSASAIAALQGGVKSLT